MCFDIKRMNLNGKVAAVRFFLSASSIIEASWKSHVASCHKRDYFRKSKFHSVWLEKSGTHDRVPLFTEHLRKVEIRQRNRGRRQEERNESGKKHSGHEKCHVGPIVQSHLNSFGHVSHSWQSVKKWCASVCVAAVRSIRVRNITVRILFYYFHNSFAKK